MKVRLAVEQLDARLVMDAGPSGTLTNPQNPAAPLSSTPPPNPEAEQLWQQIETEAAAAQNIASAPPVPTDPGVGPATPNTQRSELGLLLWQFMTYLPPPTRSGGFQGLQPPPGLQQVPGLPQGQQGNQGTNVVGGTHAFVRPTDDPNRYYGTGGAASCVGLIVRMPDGTLAIFHFQVGEDVAGTLSQYRFPPGSTFVLFGSDGSAQSNALLQSVRSLILLQMQPFMGNNYTLYAVPDADSVWVDKDGKWYYKYDPSKTL